MDSHARAEKVAGEAVPVGHDDALLHDAPVSAQYSLSRAPGVRDDMVDDDTGMRIRPVQVLEPERSRMPQCNSAWTAFEKHWAC